MSESYSRCNWDVKVALLFSCFRDSSNCAEKKKDFKISLKSYKWKPRGLDTAICWDRKLSMWRYISIWYNVFILSLISVYINTPRTITNIFLQTQIDKSYTYIYIHVYWKPPDLLYRLYIPFKSFVVCSTMASRRDSDDFSDSSRFAIFSTEAKDSALTACSSSEGRNDRGFVNIIGTMCGIMRGLIVVKPMSYFTTCRKNNKTFNFWALS